MMPALYCAIQFALLNSSFWSRKDSFTATTVGRVNDGSELPENPSLLYLHIGVWRTCKGKKGDSHRLIAKIRVHVVLSEKKKERKRYADKQLQRN
jgi:hypothetical protein